MSKVFSWFLQENLYYYFAREQKYDRLHSFYQKHVPVEVLFL